MTLNEKLIIKNTKCALLHDDSSLSRLHNPQIDAPKRRVCQTLISANYLYNRLQSPGGMILVDTRSKELYIAGHILSSINIPSPLSTTNASSDKESTKYKKNEFHNVYLNEIERSISPTEAALVFRKRKLIEIIIYSDEASVTWLKKLSHLLVDEGLSSIVRILYGHYQLFQNSYPFMCGTSLVSVQSDIFEESLVKLNRTDSGNHKVTYPNEIIEGFLYMGNMWQAQQETVISHIGITDIINASLDCDNKFANQNVKYLNIRIKDKAEEDISQYFEDCNQFIDAAAKNGHNSKVLVHCSLGISRSAAIVISYIMKRNNWSLLQSHKYVLQRRGVIFPNMGFMRQLRQYEIQLYQCSSVEENELDLLLQGSLQERDLKIGYMDNRGCPNCILS